jgi:N-6 DNA Methylase
MPVSKWTNFKGLFHFCNVGNFDRDIEAFNGGLFAPDPILDRIEVPDDLVTGLAKLGEWDYRSDVPVTILGHIFEQSITDLEKLRAEGRGEEPPKVSKRKREGVVYTPDTVTRFLVERTLGLTLAERFSALLREHARVDVLPKNGDAIPWREGEASERAFWRAYLAVLRDVTVVDPACGSGAFLVEAFDLLSREYRQVTERLAALDEPVDFDPLDWIVTRNLHGVDLNAESVEITRLSLWLKTARRKHRLQNLEATIKAGNSLSQAANTRASPSIGKRLFPRSSRAAASTW